jgi:uncharacterized protein (DUF305 family)
VIHAIWLLVGVLAVTTSAAQMEPHAAKFMQEVQPGIARMNHDPSAAATSGNVDYHFAAIMIPHHQGIIDTFKSELSQAKIS